MPAPTVTHSQVQQENINPNIVRTDYSSKIYDPEYNDGGESALLLLNKVSGKRMVPRDRYDTAESQMPRKSVKIASITAPTAATITLSAADMRWVSPHMMMLNAKTREMIRIESVNRVANTVETTRDFAEVLSGASAATQAGDVLELLGPAEAEGTNSVEPQRVSIESTWNVCGYLKTSVEISRHAMNLETEFDKMWPIAVAKMIKQHRIWIARAIYMSYRKVDAIEAGTGHLFNTTGGIFQHVTSNTYALGAGGVPTLRAMQEFSEQAFLAGGDERWMFGGAHFLSAMAALMGDMLVNDNMYLDKYSVKMKTFETPHGIIHLVKDPTIFSGVGDTSSYTGGTLATEAYCLDLKQIQTVERIGMGTELFENVQASDLDGRKDEMRSTFGLDMSPGIGTSIYDGVPGTDPDASVSSHSKLTNFKTYI